MNKQQDTNLIAKGYVNIANAAKFLQTVAGNGNASPAAKHRLNSAINRLTWCLNDIKTALTTPEAREAFQKEIDSWETLSFEEVAAEMLLMSQEQRQAFETFAKAYRKGEIQYLEAA